MKKLKNKSIMKLLITINNLFFYKKIIMPPIITGVYF